MLDELRPTTEERPCPHCGAMVAANKRLCHRCGKAIIPDPILRGPGPSELPLLTGNAKWDRVVGVGIALGTGLILGGLGYLLSFFPTIAFLYGLGWIPAVLLLIGVYSLLRDRYPIVAKSYRIAALLLFIAAPICGLLGAFAVCIYQFSRMN